jgi:tetratricopeptide (TPR) repeat protein
MTLPVMIVVASLAASPQVEPPQDPPAVEELAQEEALPPAEPIAEDLQATAEEAIERGLAAFSRRRYQAAETAFREALETDPESAAAAFYLGYTLYKVAEPTRRLTPGKQEAAQMFAKAYGLDPQFRPVWAR